MHERAWQGYLERFPCESPLCPRPTLLPRLRGIASSGLPAPLRRRQARVWTGAPPRWTASSG
ncbi:hypothetical protein GCM10010421_61870 [Streptomyces glaucus]|uniref:Uncharacterized protein n=1 Tax=Streptomyces glaucus TaxID=284029 RepID=A0ABP5XTT6_9ACTN